MQLETPSQSLKSKQQEIAMHVDEGPLYENSTRIPVTGLNRRIQEEKMRSPDHPFKEEFLVKSTAIFSIYFLTFGLFSGQIQFYAFSNLLLGSKYTIHFFANDCNNLL